MKRLKTDTEMGVPFEPLEARLLLSLSGFEGIKPLGCIDVPQVVVEDVLPNAKNQDLVDPVLRGIGSEIGRLLENDPLASPSTLSSQFVRVDAAGSIDVSVYVQSVDSTVVSALEAAGLDVDFTDAYMQLVHGWVPHTMLDAVAGVSGVKRIAPPMYAVTNTGSVTTAGDAILNADDLRALFGGTTGDGVKVGVISDGVDHWTDVAAAPYYDLPASITIDPTRSGSGDEGTAMLEIVYDIAPDADLYFSGPSTSAEMVQSISWLVSQGVDVIVDDLSFFDQPMFEDGTIASSAASAVSQGVVYTTSAGNFAQTHYQGDYEPTSGQNSLHLFPSDDNLLVVEVPTSGTVYGVLEWSDAWGSSGNDYELYLYAYTDPGWDIVDYSTYTQDGDDNPWEFVSYTNPGYSYLGWAIDQYSGLTRELEFYTYGDITAIDLDDVTAADSIFGHAAVESVITVGAIDAADSGNDDVEDFSSRGPSTIYTDFVNQTSTERNSLDVCGIDGVQTKVGQLGHFSNPFFGTSAAAPHIAGIAALLLEIDSGLTPADTQDLINDNAVDIEAAGYDHVSGHGRADALATVTTAAGTPDLRAVSDTGMSDSDDITKLDNSETAKRLEFDVSGTISGATVTLYDGQTQIGSGTGNGGTITITTNGTYDLTDGDHNVTARQTETGKLESPDSSALQVTVDTEAPVLETFKINVRKSDGQPADLRGEIGRLDLEFAGDEEDEIWLQLLYYDSGWTDGPSLSSAEHSWNDGNNTARWDLWDWDHDPSPVPLVSLANGWYFAEIKDLAGNEVELDEGLEESDLVFHRQAGDINGDGLVDTQDFSILKANFGQSGDPEDFIPGDLNLDGLVDTQDFSILKAHFGQSVGSPPSPPA